MYKYVVGKVAAGVLVLRIHSMIHQRSLVPIRVLDRVCRPSGQAPSGLQRGYAYDAVTLPLSSVCRARRGNTPLLPSSTGGSCQPDYTSIYVRVDTSCLVIIDVILVWLAHVTCMHAKIQVIDL